MRATGGGPMTESEACEIAERFVAKDADPSWPLRMLGARRRPGYWAVVFERRDKQGHILDGPMVVHVDEATGQAAYL
ncbi:MAG: hypothetical protein JST54_29210 [Deltaproteobacteria bacterium]|nr:hypothetical protein [Deltaproteobacteria bacterium]